MTPMSQLGATCCIYENKILHSRFGFSSAPNADFEARRKHKMLCEQRDHVLPLSHCVIFDFGRVDEISATVVVVCGGVRTECKLS